MDPLMPLLMSICLLYDFSGVFSITRKIKKRVYYSSIKQNLPYILEIWNKISGRNQSRKNVK